MKAKKIVSVTLATFIAILNSGMSAFAQDSSALTENTIDASLRTRGYPQVVLDFMPTVAKQSIYEDTALYFKGATIVTYNQETGTFADYQVPANGIMPAGQISTDDLSLVWSVNGNKYDDVIDVKFSYEWTNLPFFRWQDNMSVSWDGDLFEMVDDSFYKVDYFDGLFLGANGEILNEFDQAIHSEEDAYASGFRSGVTWYADLKGHTAYIQALYGYGEFQLRKKTSGSGITTIYGHYVHPTISTSLGISIGGVGEFSVDGQGGYDELGDQTTFYY